MREDGFLVMESAVWRDSVRASSTLWSRLFALACDDGLWILLMPA